MDRQTSNPEQTLPKRPSKIAGAIKMILLAVFGGAAGYFSVQLIQSTGMVQGIKTDLTGPEKLWIIPALLLVIMVVIAVHELGHLLTGLAQGFKFQLFVVGPLGIRRDPDTDRIVWYFNKELNQAGGLAATTPRDYDPNNIWKFTRLVIAGPLASLLLSALLLWLCWGSTGFWGFLGLVGAAFSLIIFLITILPIGDGTFMSDGKRFLRLLDKDKRPIELAIMRISAAYSITGRYEQMDPQDIELLKNDTSPTLRTLAYLYAYLHYQSVGKPEKAAAEEQIYRRLAVDMSGGLRKVMDKEIERINKLYP